MGLNAAGFELTLNGMTDATLGINSIKLDHDGYYDSGAKAVTFGAAVGAASSGTIDLSGTYTFTVTGGNYVFGIELYNDTTKVGYVPVTQVQDDNDFDYIVDGLTITLT